MTFPERPACLPRERLERPYNDWEAPALPPKPTLALCESAAEAAWLAGEAAPSHDAIIALTAEATCECRLRAIPYLKLEDFYDASALLAADEPMLALQIAWSEAIDAFVWDALPELADAGVRPAGHWFLQLKVLIDRLYQASFGLSHLMLGAGPGRVLHFARVPRRRSVPNTLYFDGPIYGTVLPHASRAYGAEAVALPAAGEPLRQPLRGRGLRGSLEAVLGPRLTSELAVLRQSGLAGLGLGRRPEAPEVLFQVRAYDLAQLMEPLAARGYAPSSLREYLPPRPLDRRRTQAAMRRSLEELWPALLRGSSFAEPFRWAGLDLLPIAESRLRHWWLKLVPSLWRAYTRAQRSFAVRRPRAAVFYSPVTPEDHGALQAARAARIPTITHQHGGFEGNCEYITYEATDLRLADHRLVYGDGVAGYMRDRAERVPAPRPRIASVGSARLDALQPPAERRELRRQLGIAEDEKAVLYLASSYQHASWYLCRGAYLQVPYFELLASVVETLALHPELRFVYKPFPEQPPDPAIRLFEARAPGVSVLPNVRATELFVACDAFVIDIPSTALLEAMLTRKPILVHADSRFIALRPEARELLRRRADLSETPAELESKLETFLSTTDFRALDDPDDSFLRAYGTHLGDGRSADRAAEALVEIASTRDRDTGIAEGVERR